MDYETITFKIDRIKNVKVIKGFTVNAIFGLRSPLLLYFGTTVLRNGSNRVLDFTDKTLPKTLVETVQGINKFNKTYFLGL